MPGFDLIDKKELSFSIPFIAAPALILACVNFKLDVLTTIPLTLISSYIMTQRAFDPADDNMACFENSDKQGVVLSSRQTVNLVSMIAIGYIFRKLSLQHTMELDRSNKQQNQLKNLCDNLPDGVFILSKSTSLFKKALVKETRQAYSSNVQND